MGGVLEKGQLWGHGTPQTRVMAGNSGDPGEGPGTKGIQERFLEGTAGILKKGHSWGPQGSWRRNTNQDHGYHGEGWALQASSPREGP